MYDREPENLLKFPANRYARAHADRPRTKAEWLRWRRLGRLWRRLNDKSDAWPPYEASAYWAWDSAIDGACTQPSLGERLAQYKYDQANPDMPF